MQQQPSSAGGAGGYGGGRGQQAPGGRFGGGRPQQQDDNTALESKIYVSGLPPDTTEDMLVEHFGAIGVIARKREKRGYKDQWPYNIKLYYNDDNTFKGDALVAFEDPNAAKAAPGFFDGGDFHGHTISVQLARKG